MKIEKSIYEKKYTVIEISPKEIKILCNYAHLIDYSLGKVFVYRNSSDEEVKEKLILWPAHAGWVIDKAFIDEVIKHNIITIIIKDEIYLHDTR